MNSIDKLAAELQKAIANGDSGKKKGYDTQAEVTRLDGDTVWVKIAGGDDETPVSRTNNANVGDNVLVRISGGRAWLLGNQTSPATDDTVANEANHQAYEALGMAASAGQSAELAKTAAEVAVQSAEEAQLAAGESNAILNNMKASAEAANTTLEGIYKDAMDAKSNAEVAQNSADIVQAQLSIVENVVGVLQLAAEHGEYTLSTDTEVNYKKWYFTRSGTDPNYIYSLVDNPTGDPSAEGWYELNDIDEAIRNYVSSQLVVDSAGLWLKTFDTQSRILLSTTEGVVLYGNDGNIIGKYGEVAQIGNENGFHIQIGGDNNEIGFYQGADNRVAYINGQALYVENSLSFGKEDSEHDSFIFYQRANGHFTLKLSKGVS